MTFKPMADNPVLRELLEKAKLHVMTPAERAEQRVSWAYGQLAIEDPTVTKDSVRQAADEMEGRKGVYSIDDLIEATRFVTIMAKVPEEFRVSKDIHARLEKERREQAAAALGLPFVHLGNEPDTVFGVPVLVGPNLPDNTWMEVYRDKYVIHTLNGTINVPNAPVLYR